MRIFTSDDTTDNARTKLQEAENQIIFSLIVTLISMLNKTFYSPVSFLVEYLNNPSLQKLIEEKTGINCYNFVVAYMEEFPTVTTSRKLKANLKQ